MKHCSCRRASVGVALFLLILAGLPRAAMAEWHLTPLIGMTFKGDTTLADLGTIDFEPASSKRHWNFGGALTLIGGGPLGVEALLIYTPGFFQSDDGPELVRESRTVALMGNLVLATPRNWNEYGLRPYVSGGFGLLHASARDANEVDIFAKSANLFAYNAGGGAIGFLSERAGLRFDLRYFSHVRPVEDLEIISFGPVKLSYWTASVGVVIRY